MWANADTPQDAAVARTNGAQGVGLVRTEHMFFSRCGGAMEGGAWLKGRILVCFSRCGGVFYSCLGRREGAYNPCPKWARIYRLMTESGSKAFPASRCATRCLKEAWCAPAEEHVLGGAMD